jgi:hypothetical protein
MRDKIESNISWHQGMLIMTLVGTIKNGVVVLDNAPPLADGTRVQVLLPAETESAPTLSNLLKLAGTVNDLPADMAEQHDHYLHGTPRR